jgi:DNA transformation protein
MARNLRTPAGAGRRPGSDLASLPNLGPASAAMLAAAGVPDAAALRALGAAAAFRRVLFARGGRASRTLLWALEGALTGRRWDRLDAATKARLLREVEADDC